MSKSILVIDTPEKCLDCPLGNSEEYGGEDVYCTVLECMTYQSGLYEDAEKEEMYNSKKPDYCPLEDDVCPDEFKVKLKRLGMLDKYEAIGTLDECREAREKQSPKSPCIRERGIYDIHAEYSCPECDFLFYIKTEQIHLPIEKMRYCPNCGIAIDWSYNDD